MRVIVYGSFLIICCALIQISLAENRSYKRSRDDEDNSVERPSKYKGEKKYKSKYRTDIDDEDEDHRINKLHNRRRREEERDFAKENKYSKKANVDPDEEQSYNKNKKIYGARKNKDAEGSGRKLGKKKSFVEDDSDEDSNESNENLAKLKRQLGRDNKEDRIHSKFDKRKFEENTSAEKTTKTKKYPNKRPKDINDDGDSEEETVKFEKKVVRKTKKVIDDSEESEEESPKKKFRKKIRVRVPDSPEDDSDESEEDEGGTCERKSKKGKGRKICRTEESANGDGEAEDEPVRQKKIKYSIKFAHEKEKNIPNEDENIMLKIHRGDNKKYKYQDDDDDDSSEENTFPKRIRFLDDDDE